MFGARITEKCYTCVCVLNGASARAKELESNRGRVRQGIGSGTSLYSSAAAAASDAVGSGKSRQNRPSDTIKTTQSINRECVRTHARVSGGLWAQL